MKTLLSNVWIYEGTAGAGLFRGELLFDEQGVLAAGKGKFFTSSSADMVLDGKGLVVSPGFVDVHTHCDASLLFAPEADNFIAQGVTEVVGGNCGLSLFPATEKNREHLEALYREYDLHIRWGGFASFRAELERRGHAVNCDFLCGHNTLRAAVAGYEKEELSGAELEAMGWCLDEQIRQGAKGLSLGLLYIPGCFSSPGEIEYLLRRVPLAAAHLRSEGRQLLESLDEYLGAGARSGVRHLQISHLKTAGKENFGKLPAALERIEDYASSGRSVAFDRYPYVESRTSLSVICPFEADDAALSRRLADKIEWEALLEHFRTSGRDWSTVRLAATASKKYRKYAGRRVTEIAAAENEDPFFVAADLLREDGTTQAAFAGMSRENMLSIIASERCMPGSDEGAFGLFRGVGDGGARRTPAHPRACGTFPEFIRLALEAGNPLEEVLYRCSTLPAELFALGGCGRIAPEAATGRRSPGGRGANLVLFDPERIGSKAGFAAPSAPPEGVAAVWSRGVFHPFEI